MSIIPLSWEEEQAARKRVLKDAYERLVIGPGQALLGGFAAVFGVGCLEGWCYLRSDAPKTMTSFQFILRYGLAQVIPSLVWGQQPPRIVAQVHKIDYQNVNIFLQELPPKRIMAVNYLIAIRGAIAGTVLISQVVSFAGVSSEAKAAYSRRIEAGREPPLQSSSSSSSSSSIANKNKINKTNEKNNRGVVIRLAGKTSDVTSLSMEREGRRFLFPVFEVSALVQPMLRRHGVKRGNHYAVPLYWQVDDGQYGFHESWSGLTIPQTWLFEKASHGYNPQNKKTSSNDAVITLEENKKNAKKLLILEAAANREGPSALSLATSKVTEDLDLNLYEIAQGFYQLQKLVETDSQVSSSAALNYETLRVLLADANSKLRRGGGQETSVRDRVTKLGLADIIVDSQAPILLAVKDWLMTRKVHRTQASLSPWTWLSTTSGNEVILETPEDSWFLSIREELKNLGYRVIDISEALHLYGTAHSLPILVYERTTQDTIHTIRRLVQQNIVRPQDVCALCPTHRGLKERREMDDNSVEIANICSSDLHDRLLRNVRQAALNGLSKDEIQQQLDHNLVAFLNDNDKDKKDWSLCIQL